MSKVSAEYIVKATVHIILIGRKDFSADFISMEHSHPFYELRIYKFDDEDVYYKELFSPNVEHSLYPARSGDSVYVLFSGIDPDISKLSDQMCKKVLSSKNPEDLYNSFMEILCCINTPLLGYPNSELSKIVSYIKSNLERKISVRDIAQSVHMTPQYLGQFFKKQMGMSVLKYVNEHKMIIARNMLLSGKSVEAVSEQLGFDDISYFSKVFKRYYGITPADIKNRKIYK